MITQTSKLTPEQEELLHLRDVVFEQQEELVALRSEMRLLKIELARKTKTRQYVFPCEMRLRRGEEKLLSAILDAPDGIVLSYDDLVAAISSVDSESTRGTLKATISTLRRKVEPHGLVIWTQPRIGLYLDPSTREVFMSKVKIVLLDGR